MHHEHRFDLARAIGGQAISDEIDWRGPTPRDRKLVDRDSERSGTLPI